MSTLSSHRIAAGIATAALLVLGACGSDDAESSSDDTVAAAAPEAGEAAAPVTVLTPEAGAALIADRADAVTIIDVRTPEEFATGHLVGAVNIDVQGAAFTDEVSALDPAGAYVVYCRSGNRSAAATAMMAELGFTELYDLGGIQDWVAAGYETTT